ncbi:hypothetical protein [Agrobacterium tumefaciens]|uniref:hypothetical protein n=1 Tax=Agrobacterium tumefaciens TaxID=358 RepID=UPI000DD2D93F|nr:hypothetical protein [Agrobacterium tumefaciens]MDP9872332.1 hypothetical protein [Agrobacterium tumefaciens]MDP9975946.1 hypothetical protein [Agrobacterium tumefaciens]
MTNWDARAIFCDDIRIEFNGKAILIGIYQGALGTLAFPMSSLVSTYVDIRGLDVGEHKAKIRAEYVSEAGSIDIASLESALHVQDSSLPTIIQGNGMNLAVEEPGILKLWLGIDEQEPRVVDTLRVNLGPSLADDGT